MFRKGARLVGRGVLAGGAAYGVLITVDKERREHFLGTLEGLTRFGRTLTYGALAAFDYKKLGWAEDELGRTSDEFRTLRKEVDKRNALRMLHVCKTQGAFYTKFGQYVSTLNYALPPEWTDTLSELQDKARFRPWSEMRTVLEQDFPGHTPETLFASIEQTPIAAASLAQVHKAVTADGQTVAVKIQYPDLRRLAMNDLAAMNVFFHLVEYFFPHYGFTWLFPEFKTVLSNEVDFLQEARNAERVAAQFADDSHIHIPSVRRDLTTDRVLTMEFIEGGKGNDQTWMRAHNIDPKAVAGRITKFFAEQVHEKGMVHCDPHPGNLMVRLHPLTRQWQLVVLDHGMYRRLTPGFRTAYCQLWRALLTNDDVEGRRACVALGLRNDEYDAMSLILTMRRAGSNNRLGSRISKKEAYEVYDKYKDVTPADINRFMQRLPRDLLFVSRNANLVRSLNMELGGSTRDRFRAHGRAAVKGQILSEALLAHGVKINVELPNASLVRSSFTGGGGEQAGERDIAHSPAVSGSSDGGHLIFDTSKSVLDSLAALFGRAPPVREPLTYLNALSSGGVMDNPTEWELLAAVTHGQVSPAEASSGQLVAAHEGQVGKGKAVLSKPRLGMVPTVKLFWSWLSLEGTLVFLDGMFVVAAWWTGGPPETYISPHEQKAIEAQGGTKQEAASGKEKVGGAGRKDLG